MIHDQKNIKQGRTSGSEEGTVKENKPLEYSPEKRSPASGVK